MSKINAVRFINLNYNNNAMKINDECMPVSYTHLVPIVFEDDAVIVCEKPAGMPVQSDHTRDMDVLTILKHHIFEEMCIRDSYVF